MMQRIYATLSCNEGSDALPNTLFISLLPNVAGISPREVGCDDAYPEFIRFDDATME